MFSATICKFSVVRASMSQVSSCVPKSRPPAFLGSVLGISDGTMASVEGFTCLEVLLQWEGAKILGIFFGRDEHEPVAMKANLLAVATKSSLRPDGNRGIPDRHPHPPKELHQQLGGQTFSERDHSFPLEVGGNNSRNFRT
jgi:hypothetical protein